MSSDWEDKKFILALMGQSLLCIQQTEIALSSVVETVLDDPRVKLMEQTELERKKTLGDFIRN